MNNDMSKADRFADLGLRILVFAYSCTILRITLFQIRRDRQFLIAMGIFAFICTSVYLIDAVYRMATGKPIERLQKIIYGTSRQEEIPDLKKMALLICYLAALLALMHLFGIFVVTFLAMASFPVMHDRRNPVICLLVAGVTSSVFYYVFVHMMGIGLYSGAIIGF